MEGAQASDRFSRARINGNTCNTASGSIKLRLEWGIIGSERLFNDIVDLRIVAACVDLGGLWGSQVATSAGIRTSFEMYNMAGKEEYLGVLADPSRIADASGGAMKASYRF